MMKIANFFTPLKELIGFFFNSKPNIRSNKNSQKKQNMNHLLVLGVTTALKPMPMTNRLEVNGNHSPKKVGGLF